MPPGERTWKRGSSDAYDYPLLASRDWFLRFERNIVFRSARPNTEEGFLHSKTDAVVLTCTGAVAFKCDAAKYDRVRGNRFT